jgi:hypothetical protein
MSHCSFHVAAGAKEPVVLPLVSMVFLAALALCVWGGTVTAQGLDDDSQRNVDLAHEYYRMGLLANSEVSWNEAKYYLEGALKELARVEILKDTTETPDMASFGFFLDSIAVAYRTALEALELVHDDFGTFISQYSGSFGDRQKLLVHFAPLSLPPVIEPFDAHEEHLNPGTKQKTSNIKSTLHGFNGFEWGTSATKMRELCPRKSYLMEGAIRCGLLVEYDGQIEYIHSVKVRSSTLSFYNDKFFKASISFEEDASKLRELLTTSFGPPTSIRPGSKQIEWTDIHVFDQMRWTSYEWDQQGTRRQLRVDFESRGRKDGGSWSEWTRIGDTYDVVSVRYQHLSDSCTDAAQNLKDLKDAQERKEKSADF